MYTLATRHDIVLSMFIGTKSGRGLFRYLPADSEGHDRNEECVTISFVDFFHFSVIYYSKAF